MSEARIGVVFGGWGEERRISINTGEAVVSALRARGRRVTPIVAGPHLAASLRKARLDVAFLALHGRMGEDGCVQGLLEVMGIPYTGSGVAASALAMNKRLAKEFFRAHNLATATGYSARLADVARLDELHGDLGFPCVVKPSCGGSSMGLTLVATRARLGDAVRIACGYGGEALIERYARGREVTVALLDGDVLGSCEIDRPGAVFDVAAKYETHVACHFPPRLSGTRIANLETAAARAYEILGCRGAARVDFIVPDDGNETILEVNSLPGMTQTSLFPLIARGAGVSFEELCERILLGADLHSGTPRGASPDQSDHQAPIEHRCDPV
jgi:D-alanine-D-alanine ligase